jgi:hypothetical protein
MQCKSKLADRLNVQTANFGVMKLKRKYTKDDIHAIYILLTRSAKQYNEIH